MKQRSQRKHRNGLAALRHRPLKDGVLICADALDALRTVESDSADIVFLDPPFNLGKKYGGKPKKADVRAEAEYESFIVGVLLESVRVLKPGGALYLYHIPKWAIVFASHLTSHLTFRHWIAVSMKNGFVRGQNLYPAHYALLFFTKGEAGHFHRPKVPIQVCRHCKKSIRDYGGYKHLVSGGVNLSDVWDDLSPVRHRHLKTRAANELPSLLLTRIVSISGAAGGLIVDPFAGSGTTGVAAQQGRMRYILNDREPTYYRLMYRRLTNRL